jgi:hypothetical protein
MTFIVGRDGDVYQKDLGPETARVATGGSAISVFFRSVLNLAHFTL